MVGAEMEDIGVVWLTCSATTHRSDGWDGNMDDSVVGVYHFWQRETTWSGR